MRTSKIYSFIICILSLLNSTQLRAQDSNKSYKRVDFSLAEDIYIDLDNRVYTNNNTIWLKFLVTNTQSHKPTELSKILYVELISESKEIIEKKTIPIKSGIGDGSFKLNSDYPEGLYQIRAYTHWNRNFGDNFICEEYIFIFDQNNKSRLSAIDSVNIIQREDDRGDKRDLLRACLTPNLIDPNQKNILTVNIDQSDSTQSLRLKPTKSGNYILEHPLSDTTTPITLSISTSNGVKYSKTFVLDEEYIDLKLHPRGGKILDGLPCKITVRSTDGYLNGKPVSGTIVDQYDSIVSKFRCNSFGLGTFTIESVDRSKEYYALIDGKNSIKRVKLPKVFKTGISLELTTKNRSMNLTLQSPQKEEKRVNIEIYHCGLLQYKMKGRVNQGHLEFKVHNYQLPDGVLYITVKDSTEHKIASGFYYNRREDRELNVNIETDKEIYNRREATKVRVSTENSEGESQPASISIKTFVKSELEAIHRFNNSISSLISFESEFNREILPKNISLNDITIHDINKLLSTCDESQYKFIKRDTLLQYYPEKHLNISGKITTLWSKKRASIGKITLMSFGENRNVYQQTTDSLGQFYFNLNDEYGDDISVILQTSTLKNRNRPFNIHLNTKESPNITFRHNQDINKLDNVLSEQISEHIKKNIERKKIDDKYRPTDGITLLGEVTVTASTPLKKEVIKRYGEASEVIEGKDILEKEPKWSYGLYSVLLFRYPDVIEIDRRQNGDLYAKVIGTDMTLVIIDGIPVKHYAYDLIPHLPVSEVKSFEIIKYAKNFTSLYMDVAPPGSKPPSIMSGSVVAIYTHAGKGLYAVEKPVGLSQTSIQALSKSDKFSAPIYSDTINTNTYRPDLRSLIHWEPKLSTGNSGKVSTTFHNGDTTGEMLIVVEALSTDGKIGYKEYSYRVEDIEAE